MSEIKTYTKETIRKLFPKIIKHDDQVTIPCGTDEKIYVSVFTHEPVTDLEDVEYFFISHPEANLCGGSIKDVIDTANNIDKYLTDFNDDMAKLKKYFEEHKDNWDDDSWDFYSDWHKDIYGHRPRSRENAPA